MKYSANQLRAEFFPILKQFFDDCFGLELFLIDAPYSEVKTVDKGLRQALLKDYDTSFNSISSFGLSLNSYNFLVVKSTLNFYNIIALFPNESAPTILATGPFLSEKADINFLNQLIRTYKIPESQNQFLRHCYQTMPTADPYSIAKALLNLLRRFIPELENISIKTVDFAAEKSLFFAEDRRVDDIAADYALEYERSMKTMLKAVGSVDRESARRQTESLLSHLGIQNLTALPRLKKFNSILNYMLYHTVTNHFVHPIHALNLYYSFDSVIEKETEQLRLQYMAYKMVESYIDLIKKYSHGEYSRLVRNIIDYIDLHLDEDLTLGAIAQAFKKTASYISTTFKAEVGEGLANYIAARRIHAAENLLLTTDRSVADISLSVGIQDFGYFTKVFKKYTNMTPSGYRKKGG